MKSHLHCKWHANLYGFVWLATAIFLVCFLGACAKANNNELAEVTAGLHGGAKEESSANPDWYNPSTERLFSQRIYKSTGEFDDSGLDAPVCHAVLSEYERRPLPHPVSLCTIVPQRGPQSFARPRWRRIDARKNLDLIGEFSILRAWREPVMTEYRQSKVDYFRWPEGSKKYGELSRPHSLPPEIFREIWIPIVDDAKRLVKRGAIWLERADVDIDNDGDRDTIYRMSPIPFLVSKNVARPFVIDEATLQMLEKHAVKRDCLRATGVLFMAGEKNKTLSEALLAYSLFDYDVLVFMNKTYLSNRDAIYELQARAGSGGLPSMRQACSFAWKFEVENRIADQSESSWPVYPKIEDVK